MSIGYFLDELDIWLAEDILDYLQFSDRPTREALSELGYVTRKANFKNVPKYEDIYKFKWYDDNCDFYDGADLQAEEHKTTISNDEIAYLKTLAKTFESDGKHKNTKRGSDDSVA